MFMPATPQVRALWARVPSIGFIARTMGSQAGFRAAAQPVHFAASAVAGAVICAHSASAGVMQDRRRLIRSAVVGQRVAGRSELVPTTSRSAPFALSIILPTSAAFGKPWP